MTARMLRPDSKGRITLGTLAQGISGYAMHKKANGTLILEPFVEIPMKGTKESFNVSVAAGIALYELTNHQPKK